MEKLIDAIKDSRPQPQIKTPEVVKGVLVMALSRMGSLNALEQTKGNPFWKRWLGREKLPSADTNGRVFAQIDSDAIRQALHHIYSRLKRNKALEPSFGGFFVLIVDGHESNASYLRCCKECLIRIVHTKTGDKIQYYHRNVTAVLLCKDRLVLLDLEPQLPGEDEVAPAMRLTERVLNNYPRAFDLINADGLYTRPNFFKLAEDHGKEVLTILKDERRDLIQDAMGLFKHEEPIVIQHGRTQRQCWDIEHFNSWPQVGREVRVVRSLETTTVRRQINKKEEQKTSDWMWASTLSKQRVDTQDLINLGHARWDIENKELNELVNEWEADHVYKHDIVAIEAFWLIIMLAYNLFHAFINLNLKPEVRCKHTCLHWARVIAAEIYSLEKYHLFPAPT